MGEMASIRPIVHYFYREFLYFPEISQSPPVFLEGASDLRAIFFFWGGGGPGFP